MEQEHILKPKELCLTYEEYQEKKSSLRNLTIDQYSLLNLLGVGSYGNAYRGQHNQTQQEVAVKVIDMRKIKQEQNEVVRIVKLRLTESEPKLMYECESPYLLKCFDVYENKDLKVLIIEYCNGKTLKAEIDERKRIPENEAWVILKHIINGLMVLHRLKIVHRDLKAENIMSHNDTYKIIDFGFSKKLMVSQESQNVKNIALGTISTMAPEVLARKPYGLKADIWSLGIIFFQMIYGAYPYDSTGFIQMYREIQAKQLFNKEEPLSYNGYTPTIDAYNFLRFSLVINTDIRPDWKRISEFPNIKDSSRNYTSPKLLKKCSLNLKENFDYREEGSAKILDKPIEMISEQKKQDTKQYVKRNRVQEQRLSREQYEREERKRLQEEIRLEKESQLSESQIQARKKEQEKKQNEENQLLWTQKAHLQCLKTQFIFRQIIYPLQLSGVFQSEDKHSVQFSYLLSVRCFNNMRALKSELQEEIQRDLDKGLIDNLKTQITILFNQVQKRFIDLSAKLERKKEKAGWRLSDFFSKRFNKQNFTEKLKFLELDQKTDFSKEEQINYTCRYYNNKINDSVNSSKKVPSVVKKMQNYQKIMLVEFEYLKDNELSFQKFVLKTLTQG